MHKAESSAEFSAHTHIRIASLNAADTNSLQFSELCDWLVYLFSPLLFDKSFMCICTTKFPWLMQSTCLGMLEKILNSETTDMISCDSITGLFHLVFSIALIQRV